MTTQNIIARITQLARNEIFFGFFHFDYCFSFTESPRFVSATINFLFSLSTADVTLKTINNSTQLHKQVSQEHKQNSNMKKSFFCDCVTSSTTLTITSLSIVNYLVAGHSAMATVFATSAGCHLTVTLETLAVCPSGDFTDRLTLVDCAVRRQKRGFSSCESSPTFPVSLFSESR